MSKDNLIPNDDYANTDQIPVFVKTNSEYYVHEFGGCWMREGVIRGPLEAARMASQRVCTLLACKPCVLDQS